MSAFVDELEVAIAKKHQKILTTASHVPWKNLSNAFDVIIYIVDLWSMKQTDRNEIFFLIYRINQDSSIKIKPN